MPSLKVELDARQARAEAQQFITSIDRVTESTERAADAIDIYGLSATRVLTAQEDAARKAAEATLLLRREQEEAAKKTAAANAEQQKFLRGVATANEVVSVGSRVRLLGEEVRNLGSGFSSTASVGVLLGTSLIDVGQAANKAQGGLGAVVTLLRSSPLLAAGAVLTAVATAMSLFGDSTRDTNSELSKQIRLQEELRRASLELAQQLQRDADFQRVGLPVDFQQSAITRVRRLTETASSLAGQKGYQTFEDLQSLTGLSKDDLTRLAPAGGIYRYDPPTKESSTFRRDLGLTNEAAREVLLILAKEARTFAQFEPTLSDQQSLREYQRELFGPFASRPVLGPELPPGGVPEGVVANANLYPDIRPVDPQAFRESQIESQRALAEFNRELERTRQIGEDVGVALGNSFFGLVQNVNNARQVLVGLLQQLAAIGQAQIVRGFANQVGNIFASTQAQNAPRTPGVER